MIFQVMAVDNEKMPPRISGSVSGICCFFRYFRGLRGIPEDLATFLCCMTHKATQGDYD